MTAPAEQEKPTERLLTPRKIVLQLIGFAVGAGLLAWIIIRSVREGDWSLVTEAHPGLLAALIGCTALSALFNGAQFWITMRPIKNVGFWHMQRLNCVANMLNYAPVRLGAIGRVLYHLRVDRLSILQIGAWFALIGAILMLGIGACLAATLAYRQLDAIWVLLVVGQIIFGALILRVMVSHTLIVRHGRGIDRMARHPLSLWGAVTLRTMDLSAYVARMAIAAAILKISLPLADIAVLAVVALAASLIPFGRLGFREFCVAAVAQQLDMLAADVQASQDQLALVESAGEALFYIPMGAIFLLWFRKRWIIGGAERTSREEAHEARKAQESG